MAFEKLLFCAGLITISNIVAAKNQTLYEPRFRLFSADTPVFTNKSHVESNPLQVAARAYTGDDDVLTQPAILKALSNAPGRTTGQCGPGNPCSNGACCNKNGYCGYGPDYCGSKTCISNCNAKAECGKYAAVVGKVCPLNVCCSQYGFCGTTQDFCGKGCDKTGGECGAAPQPRCGSAYVTSRTIGYYESWSPSRPCDRVEPEDIDVTGFTHLNFAFVYFDPDSFHLTPMTSQSGALLSRFTALKDQNPGLQTWVSVGGWAFNDPSNSPDTRYAFSNMVSSSGTRLAFMSSLRAFMQEYGFDGVDIDWEYPAADDRGGVPSDFANYVTFLKELRAFLGSNYGISITIPSSYWYLQHFDVKAIEPSVNWFNFMAYDIHGVWDSTNVYEGPYVRPHTNLTEIDEGLQLLWRAGVSASNVVLGLGWYGRSFTLSSSTCSRPGCQFISGGNPGPCTQTSGVLSDAEINKIIEQHNLRPTIDTKAAVAWITWNSDQWVSYDNAATFQLKIDYAKQKCLGGTMIWAVDLGDTSTNGDYSNLEKAEKLSIVDGVQYITPETIADYQGSADAQNTCYTTFCGGECAPGFSSLSKMNGQVGRFGVASECDSGYGSPYNNTCQSLCCRDLVNMGGCDWHGWRGQGLSCTGGCPNDTYLLAINTGVILAYDVPSPHLTIEQKCNGGYQSYCCKQFRPPPGQGAIDGFLVGPENIVSDPKVLEKRDLATCETIAVIAGGVIGFFATPLLGLGAAVVFTDYCFQSALTAGSKSLVSGYAGPLTRLRLTGGAPKQKPAPNYKPPKPKTGSSGRKKYGPYILANLSGQRTCAVTYTCGYNKGFDQVCDNQHWGLRELLGGINNVFNYDLGGTGIGRMKRNWAPAHNQGYRGSFGQIPGSRNRCECDEFPMNSLQESAGDAPQALRELDGTENGIQGLDFLYWLYAEWYPCSSLIGYPPPITWSIGQPASGDPRITATGLIQKYGWDSYSGKLPCFATATFGGAETVIYDQGFRALAPEDPLFAAYDWPIQNYRSPPVSGHLPANIASNTAPFQKQAVATPPPTTVKVMRPAWMTKTIYKSMDTDDVLAKTSPTVAISYQPTRLSK